MLTVEEIRDLFDYDQTHPFALRWRKIKPKMTRIKIGDIAGHWHEIRGGRWRYVGLNDTRYLVHHLVWTHVTSGQPPKSLAFINGDRGDCRFNNLRTKDLTKNPADYMRRFLLMRSFGLSVEDYDALLKSQNGTCAICGQPETITRKGKPMPLSVDHCHTGNHVRGLLCGNCNNGLGRFEDDPERLRRAAIYLEKWQAAPRQDGIGS